MRKRNIPWTQTACDPQRLCWPPHWSPRGSRGCSGHRAQGDWPPLGHWAAPWGQMFRKPLPAAPGIWPLPPRLGAGLRGVFEEGWSHPARDVCSLHNFTIRFSFHKKGQCFSLLLPPPYFCTKVTFFCCVSIWTICTHISVSSSFFVSILRM